MLETAPAEETTPAVEPPTQAEFATVDSSVVPDLPKAVPLASDTISPEA
jgi:hypothetical protein